ncbi:CYTH domain-containing protein [Caldibacillus lycopersici]|uniref:CYTH domain-containing protein n=1 Tax=Perspicuibacillus lycopersici TaxID=1325689 RepID=A0AAE3LLK6_9BACI|nr:CYTH domain-containing protein [Perspicuibacillus lycopersici]MCU9612430.1 CYTH domain-containing protein [Perspicuibacillus lycopersici]
MSQHLEIEYKNILMPNEFLQIQSYFNVSEQDFFMQENDYFDTADFSLKQLGCALRVRKKNGSYEFTLKEPQAIGLLETNEIITEADYNQLKNNQSFPSGRIYERLLSLTIDIPAVIYFGTLTTRRAETSYKNGLLVLDKSSYLKKEDYELEYEVIDPKLGEQNFLDLLSQFNIPKRKTDNKIVRFYKEKQRLLNN